MNDGLSNNFQDSQAEKFTGKLLIVTAPSGAGKTTIVRHLLRRFKDQFAFSVSATTRPRRDYEVDGKDYYFLSRQDFNSRLESGQFLEWEEVYKDICYGTLKSEVERRWKQRKHLIFDVDVKGAISLQKAYPQRSLSVFVRPPNFDALRQRLIGRRTEDEFSLQKRLDRASFELEFESHFDRCLINDRLEDALVEAEQIVAEFLES